MQARPTPRGRTGAGCLPWRLRAWSRPTSTPRLRLPAQRSGTRGCSPRPVQCGHGRPDLRGV